MKFCYLILLTATLTLTAYAQKPTPTPKAANNPRGVISGTVVSDDGQPLPDVEVRVASLRFATDRLSVSPKTKPNGQFRAEGLPPGRYTVTAFAPGYVPLADENFGVTTYRPGAVIDLHLTRGGVITGALTETDGAPAITVRVRALRVRDERGQAVREGYSASDLTDDQGVYRIYGLPPGSYLIATGPAQGWSLVAPDGMPPFYYPTGPPETAQQLELQYGQEISGIDMRRRRLSGHSVSGVAGISFKPEWGLRASLLRAGSGILEREAEIEGSDGGYAFALKDVPDSDYDLALEAADRNRKADAPIQRVKVRGADVTGLQFNLVEAGGLSGRVVLEKNAALANRPECVETGRAFIEEILLQPQRAEKKPPAPLGYSYSNFAPRELPDEHGAFQVKGLRPGEYRLATQLPSESWYIRASNAPGSPAKDLGRDNLSIVSGATTREVTIFISNGAATVTGRITPARAGVELPANLFVYLVPAEKDAAEHILRYAEAKASRDGVFTFANLAPGRYWIVAKTPPEEPPTVRRPLFWNATERAQLRREAETAKREITLNPCQQSKAYTLPYEAKP